MIMLYLARFTPYRVQRYDIFLKYANKIRDLYQKILKVSLENSQSSMDLYIKSAALVR